MAVFWIWEIGTNDLQAHTASIFRAELNTKDIVRLKCWYSRTRLHGVNAATCIYTFFTSSNLIHRLSCFLQMFDYWRVGIRWDVMPHRMWPNGTVPYVISPLYGECDFSTLYMVPLKPSGYYMYHQFNIQQFYVLPTQCIYVFCVDLRTNSDYFPIQH